jgi:hypothetical protein
LQGCCADAHSLLRSRNVEHQAQQALSGAAYGVQSEVRKAEVQLTPSAPGRAAPGLKAVGCVPLGSRAQPPWALRLGTWTVDTDVAHPIYWQLACAV